MVSSSILKRRPISYVGIFFHLISVSVSNGTSFTSFLGLLSFLFLRTFTSRTFRLLRYFSFFHTSRHDLVFSSRPLIFLWSLWISRQSRLTTFGHLQDKHGVGPIRPRANLGLVVFRNRSRSVVNSVMSCYLEGCRVGTVRREKYVYWGRFSCRFHSWIHSPV